MVWTFLVYDMIHWSAVLNVTVNLRIPQETEQLLSSGEVIWFSCTPLKNVVKEHEISSCRTHRTSWTSTEICLVFFVRFLLYKHVITSCGRCHNFIPRCPGFSFHTCKGTMAYMVFQLIFLHRFIFININKNELCSISISTKNKTNSQ
jgi:hypothetical protein